MNNRVVVKTVFATLLLSWGLVLGVQSGPSNR